MQILKYNYYVCAKHCCNECNINNNTFYSFILGQVNLGVIQENPAATAGVINILEDLHKYVPETPGGLFTLVMEMACQ